MCPPASTGISSLVSVLIIIPISCRDSPQHFNASFVALRVSRYVIRSHTFQGENCIISLHTTYRHGEVLHLLPADDSVPVQVVEFKCPFEFLLIRAVDEESQAENKILVSVGGWKLVERRGKFDLKYLKSNYFSVLLGDGGEDVVRVRADVSWREVRLEVNLFLLISNKLSFWMQQYFLLYNKSSPL